MPIINLFDSYPANHKLYGKPTILKTHTMKVNNIYIYIYSEREFTWRYKINKC